MHAATVSLKRQARQRATVHASEQTQLLRLHQSRVPWEETLIAQPALYKQCAGQGEEVQGGGKTQGKEGRGEKKRENNSARPARSYSVTVVATVSLLTCGAL